MPARPTAHYRVLALEFRPGDRIYRLHLEAACVDPAGGRVSSHTRYAGRSAAVCLSGVSCCDNARRVVLPRQDRRSRQ